MKTILSLGALIVVLASLAACGSTAAAPSIEVSCDEFEAQQAPVSIGPGQVDLKPGDTFTVSLCSNPSTGYSWSEDVAFDPAVITLVDRTFKEGDDASPPVVGAPGREQLTFEAVAAGTTTVVMTYDRPWSEEPPIWTVEVVVVVT